MSANTKIEWADHTWNPWWGCAKVSPGCLNCYAERMAARFGVKWGKGTPRRWADNLEAPLKWNAAAKRKNQRARVFCGSMMDIWDPEVPKLAREPIWDIIRRCPWLDFLLLSKRIEYAREFLPQDWGTGYHNVWIGITAESQEMWQRRRDNFIAIPAMIRFISYEPAVGALDLSGALPQEVHWVIAGGESGSGARAANPNWFRKLRDQCMRAQVPFFFKQWGAWGPEYEGSTISANRVAVFHPDDTGDRPVYVRDLEPSVRGGWMDAGEGDVCLYHVGKKAAGCLLDGLEWKQVPGC